MSLPPRTREAALAAIMAEVNAEKAASLGRSGSAVEKALAALAAAGPEDRLARLPAARDAVWNLFVQREAMGQRDHRDVIAHYAIPPDVLRGLGQR
ncbi:MAG: hypothetical protein K1X35_02865 [Caulobacteraceae bacterium]|nr:hypothetical protein [Caulobacteraceae bacterium]